MADQQLDVKNTKEAAVAAIKIGKFVLERLKDGAQWDDALALGSKLMDPKFRQLVEDGIKDADKVPAEISDLSFPEGVELLSAVGDALKEAA